MPFINQSFSPRYRRELISGDALGCQNTKFNMCSYGSQNSHWITVVIYSRRINQNAPRRFSFSTLSNDWPVIFWMDPATREILVVVIVYGGVILLFSMSVFFLVIGAVLWFLQKLRINILFKCITVYACWKKKDMIAIFKQFWVPDKNLTWTENQLNILLLFSLIKQHNTILNN